MSTDPNQVILDAIREGKRRALAYAECHYKRDINVNCDDDGCDGQLVEVPFASEDNDGSAMTNTDDDKRSDMRMTQDESGRVAAAACSILRSGGVEEKELILVKAQTIFDERSDGASATKPLDQYTTEEGRVLVRLRYLLTPESLPIKDFVQYGCSAHLPWHIRTECLRCLWSDISPTATVRANMNRNDWDKLLKLVEGIEVGTSSDGTIYPPAQVRSAALKVISTHRHVGALPRLRRLCSRYDDNSNEKMDSKTPLPGWFDGLRQVELTRALLGDTSCYSSVIMRLYDPTEVEREEARTTLAAIANNIGDSVEVARRVIVEHELTDESGELPDFIAQPLQNEEPEKERASIVWQYLIENHWNELIIRWASDTKKGCTCHGNL